MINIYTPKEISAIRKANEIVARALILAQEMIAPGVNVNDVDAEIENFIVKNGARPAFKGLYGFPNSACISINEVIIHGIPSGQILNAGDIIGVDVGVEIGGFYGDGAVTVGVGEISLADQKIISCAKNSLENAIKFIREGLHFKELSAFLGFQISQAGFVPLKDFCGHGIGKSPHEEPSILNYVIGSAKSGPKIKNGMVFCIEPMVCESDGVPQILNDGWSVVARDGKRTAHYEHAVAIIDGRAEILTQA